MSKTHTINTYQPFKFRSGEIRYTIDTRVNGCEDIEEGHKVILGGEEYVVTQVSWFHRAFDDMDGNPVRGENCTIKVGKNG